MSARRAGHPFQRLSKGTQAILIALGAFVLVLVGCLFGLASTGLLPRISLHGWIAMAIGLTFTLGIGCGLMWLSFYSARAGFDDRADPGRLGKRFDS